jgi:tetratricopeptide (TPR) repeat protein
MRPDGKAAAAVLLAAFVAVGCSGSSDERQPQVSAPPDSAPARPALEPLTPNGTDEEGFTADAQPAIAGPVSFADGEALYAARKYGEAAVVFERYVEERPANAWGHFMLGLAAWKGGDLVKAGKAFDRALTIDPDHFKSLVNLSRVLIEQKRFDDALATLMRADGVEPDSGEVQRLLGRAYHAKGKTEDAIDAYRRALELNTRDAWSMNNLALVLLEKQRAEEAIPLLLEAVELRTDVAAFQNNLGMALEHTRRFKGAATAYTAALKADPGYEKAKRNLARVEAVKVEDDESGEGAAGQ